MRPLSSFALFVATTPFLRTVGAELAIFDDKRGAGLNGSAGAAHEGYHTVVTGPERRRDSRPHVTTPCVEEFDMWIQLEQPLGNRVVPITAGSDGRADEFGSHRG